MGEKEDREYRDARRIVIVVKHSIRNRCRATRTAAEPPHIALQQSGRPAVIAYTACAYVRPRCHRNPPAPHLAHARSELRRRQPLRIAVRVSAGALPVRRSERERTL